jgi:hypothetical protein
MLVPAKIITEKMGDEPMRAFRVHPECPQF